MTRIHCNVLSPAGFPIRKVRCGAAEQHTAAPETIFAAQMRASKFMLCCAPALAGAEAGESMTAPAEPVGGIGCCSKSGALALADPQLEAVVGCFGGTGQSEPASTRVL